MKIAVISCHTPSLFWFRLDMMLAFKAEGHEVFAIGNENEEIWTDRFEENGIEYRQISVKRNSVNPLDDAKTFFSIRKILREICPDKVFVFQAKTVIYGSLAAKTLRIKEIYPLISGVGSIFLRDDIKTKFIRKILVYEYTLALKNCPKVFFQNSDDEKLFKDIKIVKNQKTVILHGSGVNLERFAPRPLPEKVGFLCIARLIRDKGIYEYLQASKRIRTQFPDVRCMLLGVYDSNPTALWEEDIEPFISDGTVEFFGERDDVRPLLAECSVFVLPSYREGVPKAVLEAMATGRAVITTDVAGCRDTVRDGKNGFLVPAHDEQALYEKMAYLAENADLIQCMGAAGRELAEEMFDVRKVNERIIDAMKLRCGET